MPKSECSVSGRIADRFQWRVWIFLWFGNSPRKNSLQTLGYMRTWYCRLLSKTKQKQTNKNKLCWCKLLKTNRHFTARSLRIFSMMLRMFTFWISSLIFWRRSIFLESYKCLSHFGSDFLSTIYPFLTDDVLALT